MKIFIIILLLVSLGFFAEAQTQEGSMAIAREITPASENIVSDATACLADAAKTLSPEKAAKFCEKMVELTVKAATRLANESADAAQAGRLPYGGYGYGYNSYGYSYGYRAPRYHTPRYSRPAPPPPVVAPPPVAPPPVVPPPSGR